VGFLLAILKLFLWLATEAFIQQSFLGFKSLRARQSRALKDLKPL